MALRQLVGRGVHIGAQWTRPKKPGSLNQVDILCPVKNTNKGMFRIPQGAASLLSASPYKDIHGLFAHVGPFCPCQQLLVRQQAALVFGR